MTCQDCKRSFDEVIDFLVSTAIWNYVMGRQETTEYTLRRGTHDPALAPRCEGVGGVVCLACFDKRARALNVPYAEYVTVLGIGCWMGAKDISARALV